MWFNVFDWTDRSERKKWGEFPIKTYELMSASCVRSLQRNSRRQLNHRYVILQRIAKDERNDIRFYRIEQYLFIFLEKKFTTEWV